MFVIKETIYLIFWSAYCHNLVFGRVDPKLYTRKTSRLSDADQNVIKENAASRMHIFPKIAPPDSQIFARKLDVANDPLRLHTRILSATNKHLPGIAFYLTNKGVSVVKDGKDQRDIDHRINRNVKESNDIKVQRQRLNDKAKDQHFPVVHNQHYGHVNPYFEEMYYDNRRWQPSRDEMYDYHYFYDYEPADEDLRAKRNGTTFNDHDSSHYEMGYHPVRGGDSRVKPVPQVEGDDIGKGGGKDDKLLAGASNGYSKVKTFAQVDGDHVDKNSGKDKLRAGTCNGYLKV